MGFLKTSFAGNEPGADLGPLISKDAKKRVLDLVESGAKEGAKIVLDGRDIKVKGYEKGNFVGPTILTDVKVISLFASLCEDIQLKFLISADHEMLHGGDIWPRIGMP